MHLTQLYGSIITLNGSSSSWVCSLASRLLFLSCYKFNGIPLHQILLFKEYIYLNQEHYGWFYGRHIDIYFHLFVKRRMKLAGVMYYYYYYYFLIKDTNDYHDSWRGFLSWLLIVSNFSSKVFLIAPTTTTKERVGIKKNHEHVFL